MASLSFNPNFLPAERDVEVQCGREADHCGREADHCGGEERRWRREEGHRWGIKEAGTMMTTMTTMTPSTTQPRASLDYINEDVGAGIRETGVICGGGGGVGGGGGGGGEWGLSDDTRSQQLTTTSLDLDDLDARLCEAKIDNLLLMISALKSSETFRTASDAHRESLTGFGLAFADNYGAASTGSFFAAPEITGTADRGRHYGIQEVNDGAGRSFETEVVSGLQGAASSLDQRSGEGGFRDYSRIENNSFRSQYLSEPDKDVFGANRNDIGAPSSRNGAASIHNARYSAEKTPASATLTTTAATSSTLDSDRELDEMFERKLSSLRGIMDRVKEKLRKDEESKKRWEASSLGRREREREGGRWRREESIREEREDRRLERSKEEGRLREERRFREERTRNERMRELKEEERKFEEKRIEGERLTERERKMEKEEREANGEKRGGNDVTIPPVILSQSYGEAEFNDGDAWMRDGRHVSPKKTLGVDRGKRQTVLQEELARRTQAIENEPSWENEALRENETSMENGAAGIQFYRLTSPDDDDDNDEDARNVRRKRRSCRQRTRSSCLAGRDDDDDTSDDEGSKIVEAVRRWRKRRRMRREDLKSEERVAIDDDDDDDDDGRRWNRSMKTTEMENLGRENPESTTSGEKVRGKEEGAWSRHACRGVKEKEVIDGSKEVGHLEGKKRSRENKEATKRRKNPFVSEALDVLKKSKKSDQISHLPVRIEENLIAKETNSPSSAIRVDVNETALDEETQLPKDPRSLGESRDYHRLHRDVLDINANNNNLDAEGRNELAASSTEKSSVVESESIESKSESVAPDSVADGAVMSIASSKTEESRVVRPKIRKRPPISTRSYTKVTEMECDKAKEFRSPESGSMPRPSRNASTNRNNPYSPSTSGSSVGESFQALLFLTEEFKEPDGIGDRASSTSSVNERREQMEQMEQMEGSAQIWERQKTTTKGMETSMHAMDDDGQDSEQAPIQTTTQTIEYPVPNETVDGVAKPTGSEEPDPGKAPVQAPIEEPPRESIRDPAKAPEKVPNEEPSKESFRGSLSKPSLQSLSPNQKDAKLMADFWGNTQAPSDKTGPTGNNQAVKSDEADGRAKAGAIGTPAKSQEDILSGVPSRSPASSKSDVGALKHGTRPSLSQARQTQQRSSMGTVGRGSSLTKDYQDQRGSAATEEWISQGMSKKRAKKEDNNSSDSSLTQSITFHPNFDVESNSELEDVRTRRSMRTSMAKGRKSVAPRATTASVAWASLPGKSIDSQRVSKDQRRRDTKTTFAGNQKSRPSGALKKQLSPFPIYIIKEPTDREKEPSSRRSDSRDRKSVSETKRSARASEKSSKRSSDQKPSPRRGRAASTASSTPSTRSTATTVSRVERKVTKIGGSDFQRAATFEARDVAPASRKSADGAGDEFVRQEEGRTCRSNVGSSAADDNFAHCEETVFHMKVDEESGTLAARNDANGFLADSVEFLQYFLIIAIHLGRAVVKYVACRLDEYAERALLDEEGEEEVDVDVEARRKRMRKKRAEKARSGGAFTETDEGEDEEDEERQQKKLVKKATLTLMILVGVILICLTRRFLASSAVSMLAASSASSSWSRSDAAIDAAVAALEFMHARMGDLVVQFEDKKREPGWYETLLGWWAQ